MPARTIVTRIGTAVGVFLSFWIFWSLGQRRAGSATLGDAEVQRILSSWGSKIRSNRNSSVCPPQGFGHGWGLHELCLLPRPKPCIFYSFGIAHDFSFDVDVSRRLDCSGFAFDPTVTHPSALAPTILFFKVGARLLDSFENWTWTSVPAVRKWLRHERIHVLKMDCEGCEYSLARDIMEADPSFFMSVDQFSVEIHVSRFWIRTHQHIEMLALLFLLLDNAGFQLVSAHLGRCSKAHEAYGCPSALVATGYPCGDGMFCQNLLMVRPP